MLMNCLNFCWSGNVFISCSFLKNTFSEYSILGWNFFFYHFGYFIPFSSGMRDFYREIHWQPYKSSFACDESFLSSCLQKFSLTFSIFLSSFIVVQLQLSQFPPNCSPLIPSPHSLSQRRNSYPSWQHGWNWRVWHLAFWL